ncbi:hypothetical protein BSM4216_3782 [Bacillus smithii]|nr:hypothetical protein BSM4216_3782 [Bacillus smithii]
MDEKGSPVQIRHGPATVRGEQCRCSHWPKRLGRSAKSDDP